MNMPAGKNNTEKVRKQEILKFRKMTSVTKT